MSVIKKRRDFLALRNARRNSSRCFLMLSQKNPENGESFQATVPAGCWFGATVADPGEYALVGCTVAPGFEFDDFEIASRKDLIQSFPDHVELINNLTSCP